MASRFPQRSDPRSTLFAAYDSKTRKSSSPASHASTPPYGAPAHAYPPQPPPHPGKSSPSPYRHSTSTPSGQGGAGVPPGPGGSPYSSYSNTTSSTFTSWSGPGGSGSSFRSSSAPNGEAGYGMGEGEGHTTFRSATPNSRGQYSDAVLSELENQNEEHLQGMTAKVRMLKDITTQIGHEIRSSSTLAEQLNDNFEGATLKLKGTVNRMMRMAERGTGVGWRTWVLFFAAVILLFWWVKGRGR
ncbi:MAG: protein transport protein bet1 [Alyxoria varia]|nr:MAG: protein transport protein bet1 [Alyxoria varia]